MIEVVEYVVKRGRDRYRVIFDLVKGRVRVLDPTGMMVRDVRLANGFQSAEKAELLVDVCLRCWK